MLRSNNCFYCAAIVVSVLAVAVVPDVVCSIESARAKIITTLHKENPALVAEFRDFCTQYDALVFAFFDMNNYDSLPVHIKCMEVALNTLKRVCCDTRYHSVRPFLCYYHKHIADLIVLLHQHVDYRNTLLLCFKVRKFKMLLPELIKSRGDIALFWALRHRLHCG